MPDSIEQTQELLLAAKKKTDEARRELEQTEEKIARIDSIQLNVDVSFPKTAAVLSRIEGNVSRIGEHRDAIAKLIGSMENIRKGVDEINELEQRFEAYLKEIYFLDGNHRYDEALQSLADLENLSKSFDYGNQLNVQKTLDEIIAWTRCCLYDHIGDHNIREGLSPFSQETLDEFIARVDELPTRIHKPEQIEVFRDKIRGFRCVIRAKEAIANGRSFESLNASLALIEEIRKYHDSFSRFTTERFNFLVNTTTDEYNYLCVDAFDVRREYKDAEALFNLRGYFEAERIIHNDYREAVDAHDFHIRFLKAEALRMDDEAFSIAVYAYADSIRAADEFEFEVLCQYLAMPGLSTEKTGYLIAAINRLSFELMIVFLGYALSLGIEVERQAAILEGIYNKKEKIINLDKCAKSLQNCIDLLDESLQKRFINFEKCLLRSPRAHKVCVKSANPDIHVLYGEDPTDFRRPLGKPYSKTSVKPWDYSLKTLYFAFALVLPLLLCAALLGFVYGVFSNKNYGTYLIAAPFALALLVLHFFVCARFGRDERGSAVFKRMVGLDALIKAGIALVYFVIPETLTMFAPVGIGLFIAAAFEGFWGFFLYKDYKKKVSMFIYIPLLLVLIAGIVFMILGMMNGKIG